MTTQPETVSEPKLLDSIADFAEYTQLAIRTESPQSNPTDLEVLRIALGLNAITADILDGFKKQIFYGKEQKLNDTLLPNLNQIANLVMHLTLLLHGVPNEKGELVKDEQTGLHLAEELPGDIRTMHALLGVITEGGELAEIMVGAIENDGAIDAVNLHEELHDISWYSAVAHDANSLDFIVGLRNNINKLIKRYPQKFDSEHADNRNLDAERAELERVDHAENDFNKDA
jgi:hypothetical protein